MFTNHSGTMKSDYIHKRLTIGIIVMAFSGGWTCPPRGCEEFEITAITDQDDRMSSEHTSSG